jgi:hypothetical protein
MRQTHKDHPTPYMHDCFYARCVYHGFAIGTKRPAGRNVMIHYAALREIAPDGRLSEAAPSLNSLSHTPLF